MIRIEGIGIPIGRSIKGTAGANGVAEKLHIIKFTRIRNAGPVAAYWVFVCSVEIVRCRKCHL